MFFHLQTAIISSPLISGNFFLLTRRNAFFGVVIIPGLYISISANYRLWKKSEDGLCCLAIQLEKGKACHCDIDKLRYLTISCYTTLVLGKRNKRSRSVDEHGTIYSLFIELRRGVHYYFHSSSMFLFLSRRYIVTIESSREDGLTTDPNGKLCDDRIVLHIWVAVSNKSIIHRLSRWTSDIRP